MADEGGEKTEMPTPKKLRDARQKGQVCTSKDVVSTALLVVLLFLLGAVGVLLVNDFGELLKFIGANTGAAAPDVEGAKWLTVVLILKHSLIVVLTAVVIGIVANCCQVGFLFTFEPIKPSLDKVNPAKGFKKIFCKKNFFEFFKNCVKVSFLGYLIYKIVLAAVPALLLLAYGSIDDIFPVLKSVLKTLAIYTAFGYIVIAVVDRLMQQRLFIKEMMMTKDEVKREYKEMEGSQEVKQAQREFRNEIMSGPDPRQATKKASVVVTNPTHYAVAIRFDKTEAPLPRVMATGMDRMAKLIRDTAIVYGIPIVENIPLARSLYAQTKANDFVPVELATPVAEILKWVKSLEDARREDAELDSVTLD